MELLTTLIIWIALAYWCLKIAEKNGRDKTLAFVLGALGGIFAVIIYALIGATEDEKVRRTKVLMDKAKELDEK